MDGVLFFFWRAIRKLIPLLDLLLVPFTFLAAVWFLIIRKGGIERSYFSKKIFLGVGVFPIRDHYYEPLFDAREIKQKRKRMLSGVDLNVGEQLSLLEQFDYATELSQLPTEKTADLRYFYNNPSFFAGDAEYLYSMIRLKKPRRIIEIGSGYSTLAMLEAIGMNKLDVATYDCQVTCIEPYEMPWLESTGVAVIRQKVQDVELSTFQKLASDDILFIDSSHIIRPDGDVVFEYLEILPLLNPGVIVHIHDIYTPADYPIGNFEKYVIFINEQYLLEAFLSQNSQFKIIGAVNMLSKTNRELFVSKFPASKEPDLREPRSFWIVRK